MKYLVLLIIILPLATVAQTARIQLEGTIFNELDEPMEGITVFNNNTLSGTVTNSKGKFLMDVKEGDKLALRAVQFDPFIVVVTATIVEKGEATLKLNPGVNVLEEIELQQLSMLLSVSPSKDYNPTIKAVSARNKRIRAVDRIENTFSDRVRQPEEYGLRNDAFKQNMPRFNGFNFVGLLASALTGKSLENVDLTPDRKVREARFDDLLVKNKYDADYLLEFLDLKREHLTEFMYFAQDAGITPTLLQPENETALLQLLSEQAVIFKQRKQYGTKVDAERG